LIRHFFDSCTNSIEDPIEFVHESKKCLINQREVDRVLDGEDVALLVLVDVVHHAGEGGRLTRAGGAGDQHDAARLVGDVGEDLGRLEIVQREDLGGDGAHHRRRAALLHEGVHPEARQVGHREGEVALQVLLVELALAVAHDVVDHRVHFLVLHRRHVDAAHVAVHADHRRQPGRQMQVGRLVLDHEGEQLGQIH
jgi:hypothetical protein